MFDVLRKEYPRPQFEREAWLNLNGEWDFDFDDDNIGLKEGWFNSPKLCKKINVPFTFQCELSGINLKEFHDIVWYKKEFVLPSSFQNKKILIHFGAVDYIADVWVNGIHVTAHKGGHIGFSADITHALTSGTNTIVVRAKDFSTDLEVPRGKQFWKKQSEGIFYTGTTGIWQTVWLEPVNETYLKKVWMTPDIDKKIITVEYDLNNTTENTYLAVKISYKGKVLVDDSLRVLNNRGKRDFWLDQNITLNPSVYWELAWTPKNPRLFDIEFSVVKDGVVVDEVKSYFALRKVSIDNGVLKLNNQPIYQKLLLDQGYWEESLLTAPSDEAFINDINMAKEMGFNGARKHQKIEDPRYLYWADQLGFLVWGEAANAYCYSREYAKNFTAEWIEMIERDYNHPCIITWVPINESWGVDNIKQNLEQQAHATSLYHLTKSLDQTRPVVSNDGWEHTKTDLLTIHNYDSSKSDLEHRFSTVENITSPNRSRTAFANNHSYENQPIIVSELPLGIFIRSMRMIFMKGITI